MLPMSSFVLLLFFATFIGEENGWRRLTDPGAGVGPPFKAIKNQKSKIRNQKSEIEIGAIAMHAQPAALHSEYNYNTERPT